MTSYSIGLQVLVADCIAVNGWLSKYLAGPLTLLSMQDDQLNCEWMQTCDHGSQEIGLIQLSVNGYDIMSH